MAENSHYVILIDIKEVSIETKNERSNAPTKEREIVDKTHIVVKAQSLRDAVAKVKGILDLEMTGLDNEKAQEGPGLRA